MSEEHVLPLARPQVGVSGKTGTWRVMRPEVDHSKCIKCALCWLHCPESTIDIVEEGEAYIEIDYGYCKGCGVCADVCPTKAIRMVPEG